MWPLFKCLNIDNILSICEVSQFDELVPPKSNSVLDCISAYWSYFIFLEEPCNVGRECASNNTLAKVADRSYRLLLLRSNISSSCEGGMALLFPLYMLGMQESTLKILVRGSSEWLLRCAMQSERLPKFVYATCK
jgi:hypothetical protein